MFYPHRPPPSLKLIAAPPTADPALLEAARGGDDQAFARLVEPYHSELSAHCYRMLGSAHDAEDALQEALLRAWRGLPRFEGRSSLRSWLYTIATNTCLNLIERRPKRVLPIDYGGAMGEYELGLPPLESVWVEPFPDAGLALEDGYAAPEARYELRESVELAFVAALQNLPANQRAALILREVLGFSAAEVAEALDTSVASVNSALQRARKTVDEKLPEQSQQATLRSLDDEQLRELVESYMDAMERGDVEAVMDLLAEDAVWSMPPLPAWFTGADGLREFMKFGPLSGDWKWKHIPTQANGQPAVGSYAWYEPDQAYRLFAIDVFTLSGSKIKAITSFINRSTASREELFYQRYPEQPVDESNTSVDAEAFGLPELFDR
jgi:RNA polymerase sigma-70 factor (ECF subfamily)